MSAGPADTQGRQAATQHRSSRGLAWWDAACVSARVAVEIVEKQRWEDMPTKPARRARSMRSIANARLSRALVIEGRAVRPLAPSNVGVADEPETLAPSGRESAGMYFPAVRPGLCW